MELSETDELRLELERWGLAWVESEAVRNVWLLEGVDRRGEELSLAEVVRSYKGDWRWNGISSELWRDGDRFGGKSDSWFDATREASRAVLDRAELVPLGELEVPGVEVDLGALERARVELSKL